METRDVEAGVGSPLPRGRHGIDPADVRANQRARIVDATIECVASKGFAATTVGHIVARARVSRETFYELFSDKDTCYERSLHATIGEISDTWRAAVEDETVAGAERLERGLRGYLERLTENPALTRCFVLERPAGNPHTAAEDLAGPEIATRMQEFTGADMVAVDCYLAMVTGLVRQYTVDGREAELLDLVPAIMPVARRMLELD